MKLPWIKNTAGEPSASLTLVVIAFSVIMLWMTLSIFTSLFGIGITPFNSTDAMGVLAPLLLNYWGRRNTEAKKADKEN